MYAVVPAASSAPAAIPPAMASVRSRRDGMSSGGQTVVSDGAAWADPHDGGSLAGNDSRLA